MDRTVISILGARLDHQGLGKRRWKRWRPNISILLHDDLQIDKFVLVHHSKETELADITVNDIHQISPQTEVITYVVDYDNPWDFEQVYSQLLDFAKIYPFDPEDNEYLVHITTGTHVIQICLYLLTEANYIPGKLLQTSPPDATTAEQDRLKGKYQIIDLDLSRYDQIASRFERESRDAISYLKSGIETRNAQFNQLISQLEHVSIQSTAPILLTGPTGVGKSRLAKRIYRLKKQRGQLHGKLVEVNCATLRGDNAMSALFGHVKGAYTGAVKDRQGFLREANNGLLFLDEIGELGLDEQAMLLRAIEDKVFTPFGSDQETTSDFQLIAGTNRNLFERVTTGDFREDLLARINLWHYPLPSLKHRIEDLEPNITHELENFTRLAGYKVSFNKAAKQLYLEFARSRQALWKANFRDLSSSITRMATLSSGGRITEHIVETEIERLNHDWQGYQQPVIEADDNQLLNEVLGETATKQLDLFETIQLKQVIKICQQSSSMAEAGRQLFNVSRETRSTQNDSHRLRTYLKKYGIEFKCL